MVENASVPLSVSATACMILALHTEHGESAPEHVTGALFQFYFALRVGPFSTYTRSRLRWRRSKTRVGQSTLQWASSIKNDKTNNNYDKTNNKYNKTNNKNDKTNNNYDKTNNKYNNS